MSVEMRTRSGWRRFWERGGWWRSLLLAAGYLVLYQSLSFAFAPLASGIDDPNSVQGILVFVAFPVLVGCLLLAGFLWSVGWWSEIFGRQPIGGREWMWIAVVAVLLFNALRFAAIDYGAIGGGVVASWLLAGLCIGFAEEVLTRGLVVNLLRKAGYREVAVATISAGVFAGLHSVNLLSGQALLPTLLQLLYTFAFGICMYLAMRVTGTIVAPILLHATTDPSIFLLAVRPSPGPLADLAGFGNIAVIIVGLALLACIRGAVRGSAAQSR